MQEFGDDIDQLAPAWAEFRTEEWPFRLAAPPNLNDRHRQIATCAAQKENVAIWSEADANATLPERQLIAIAIGLPLRPSCAGAWACATVRKTPGSHAVYVANLKPVAALIEETTTAAASVAKPRSRRKNGSRTGGMAEAIPASAPSSSPPIGPETSR